MNIGQVFFYVDGIPTKGAWLDMEQVNDWGDIKQQLIDQGLITENYDCDILAADAEDFCLLFIGDHGGFDLSKFVELRDTIGADQFEAFHAYIDLVGMQYATFEGFEEVYCGEWKSEEDYAQDYFESCYDIPEHLLNYIDWESVARDLFHDRSFINGYVFRN